AGPAPGAGGTRWGLGPGRVLGDPAGGGVPADGRGGAEVVEPQIVVGPGDDVLRSGAGGEAGGVQRRGQRGGRHPGTCCPSAGARRKPAAEGGKRHGEQRDKGQSGKQTHTTSSCRVTP